MALLSSRLGVTSVTKWIYSIMRRLLGLPPFMTLPESAGIKAEVRQWREEGGQGRSGWPVVDIKGWPCWISGSGDGYVPISLSNCQKSNLVSEARAGLGLNGRRQAQP